MFMIPFDDHDGFIWYDGRLVPWRDAELHVLAHLQSLTILDASSSTAKRNGKSPRLGQNDRWPAGAQGLPPNDFGADTEREHCRALLDSAGAPRTRT